MEPQLESLRTQFAAIRADAEALTSGLSDAQLRWRPKAGAWSIAECMSHLNSIDGEELPLLFRAIAMSRKEGRTAAGPFRWSLFERWFIASMEPPVRFKARAPKRWLPGPDPDPKETLLEFQRIQHDLYFLVGEADGLDLKGIKVASPAEKWLKMSLGSRIQLIAAHDRRHLWQARRVRESPEFPKS